MGLLMGAIGGAGAAVVDTTRDAMRTTLSAQLDEEKAKRIAEFAQNLKKTDAADERKRISGILKEPVKVDQGEGMLGPATGDTGELTQTTRAPTNDEMVGRLLGSGDVDVAEKVGKLDDRDKDREIKTAIAMGKFENALAIAQMKGDFGMMLGELKAAAANGNGKATELMRNWNFLTKDKGMTDAQAAEKLLTGKVGETETVSVESPPDDKGNKVTTTTKRKVNGQATTPAPAKAPIAFGSLKQ